MNELNQVGNTLDSLIKETQSSAATEPHLRSTTLGQERKPGERVRPKLAPAQLDQSGLFDGQFVNHSWIAFFSHCISPGSMIIECILFG